MSKICTTCSGGKKWLPTPISTLETYLGRALNSRCVRHTHAIKKNIAYNLQYLQFQHQLLTEFCITSVLRTQTWKTIIIIGTGILEAIGYYLVNSNGLQKLTEWTEETKTSNEFSLGSEKYKLEGVIYRRVDPPVEVEMSFDSMIKKLEIKKLLGNNHDIYKKIQFLRKLRNRVHLQISDGIYDTDWAKFNAKEINTLRAALHEILTSTIFTPSAKEKSMFDFLHMRA